MRILANCTRVDSPAMGYTLRNLRETEDSAPKFGFGELGEAHFPREELGATETGFAYHVLRPGKRNAFGHRHDEAEEVYVVIAGSGRVRLDDEIVDVSELDAIRVSPEVTRAWEAGDGGLSLIVFGARHEGDGELEHDFWQD
jgi:mannose-6-phosphate isomerase-like protein (cupin superfamily)